MNASSFLGYGIIGTADGFAAQTAGLLADMDIGSVLDLDNRQIFAPFNTEILAGIREQRDGHLYTYFVLYRYAVEQERSRLGGFYGSVVALKDCTADGFAIYNLLLELATNVKVYLDPETARFLVPMEEITFLHPNSIDELVRSVKQQPVREIIPHGYFAPLPRYARNSFRFIDFFQHEPEGIEKFFVSKDPEVAKLVKNKAGLEIKSLVLENADVEKKLEQADQIDTEIFIKEKELQNIRERHGTAATKLSELEQQHNKQHQLLDSGNSEIAQLRQEKILLEKDLKGLEKTKSDLLQQCRDLQLRVSQPETFPGNKTSQNDKVSSSATKLNFRDQLSALHPLTRMLVLILAFVSLGTIGYLTITGFGSHRKASTQKEPVPIIDQEFSQLEKQVYDDYLTFNKNGQDSFLARLSPFLSSDQENTREKAKKLQHRILTIGYDYYKRELKRTDSIPVLHSQLVEEFEIMKSEYDSVFVELKKEK